MRFQKLFTRVFAVMLPLGVLFFQLHTGIVNAKEAEKISVAIISYSPYGVWYIAEEKNMAKDIDLDIRIIEGVTEKNAAITSGQLQVVMNTFDSMVISRGAGVPIKVVGLPSISYGLDEMIVTKDIKSVKDFSGKTYGADYGFVNHMWMLLTLKRNKIPYDSLKHIVVLPQEGAAAFVSGGIDIDVNYLPFTIQSLKRKGSHALMSSFSDKTWERALVSDAIGFHDQLIAEKPKVAKELLRAWFEAVNWWKENPKEGKEIIARRLDWAMSDMDMLHDKAIIFNMEQCFGAFAIGDAKTICETIPEEAPQPPPEPSNWGRDLFNGAPDCEAGYAFATYQLFEDVYAEAGVTEMKIGDPRKGIDTSLLEALRAEGYDKKYKSNRWIGRK